MALGLLAGDDSERGYERRPAAAGPRDIPLGDPAAKCRPPWKGVTQCREGLW